MQGYKQKKDRFLALFMEIFIKTGFYFTEKTKGGINNLPIDIEIKEKFSSSVSIGKLFALSFDIKKTEDLKDFEEIMRYKLLKS